MFETSLESVFLKGHLDGGGVEHVRNRTALVDEEFEAGRFFCVVTSEVGVDDGGEAVTRSEVVDQEWKRSEKMWSWTHSADFLILFF